MPLPAEAYTLAKQNFAARKTGSIAGGTVTCRAVVYPRARTQPYSDVFPDHVFNPGFPKGDRRCPPNPRPVPRLRLSLKRPEQVYASLQRQFAGFTFTEQPEYGGGTLYEVKKGNTVRYVSLVRATDKTATFVVLWTQDPHQPTVAAH